MKIKSYRKPRPSFVCLACRSKKIKCDKGRPTCKRCAETNKLCVYETDTVGSSLQYSDNSSIYQNSLVTPGTSSSHSGNDSETNIQYYSRASSKPSPDAPLCNTDLVIEQIISTSDNNNKFEDRTSLKIRPSIIDNLKDMSIKLGNPTERLVSYGSTTYYDLPFGTHSYVQSDSYLRALCAALHGDTITELRSRLTTISTATPGLKNNTTIQNLTPQSNLSGSTAIPNNNILKTEISDKEINPLKFIEKAIVKWIENTNELVENNLPLDYFNTIHTIDDSMHPNLLSSLHTLISEIEIILVDKVVIDISLRKFYEDIYPFFPFFNIGSFEKNLSYILIENDRNRYEINVYNIDIRPKLETLVLFLLILSITLRSPSFCQEQILINKVDAVETAGQLIIFSQKILSLLNGFKFTNENILCCLLYLFVAEHLNPNNRDIDVTHDQVLTLKCINNLAVSIGLFNDPDNYPRYKNDLFVNNAIHSFRRKLWIGLQSVNLLMTTCNGGSTQSDLDYLSIFLESGPDLLSTLSSKINSDSEIERKIFSIQEDKYHFHILLARVMICCTCVNKEHGLNEITDNIKNALDFMHQRFPLSRIKTYSENRYVAVEPRWRNAKVDMPSIEATEILKMNIVGLSSIMSIYHVLIFYFEKNSISRFEKFELYYHKFFLESINVYLQLTDLVANYLSNNFRVTILQSHEYSINKQIVFTLVKLWLIQMTYAVRLSYKKEFRKQQQQAVANGFLSDIKEEDEQLDLLLNLNLSHIQKQTEITINLAGEKLSDTYFGCYQATLMVKYLIYVMDNAGLARMINRFWDRAFNTNDISEYVLSKLNMKWGLSTKGTNFIDKHLMNPESLRNLNLKLLKQVEYMFEETSFYEHPSSTAFEDNIPSTPSFNSEEILNQFLESNFDLFLGVINDNLGELPSL